MCHDRLILLGQQHQPHSFVAINWSNDVVCVRRRLCLRRIYFNRLCLLVGSWWWQALLL